MEARIAVRKTRRRQVSATLVALGACALLVGCASGSTGSARGTPSATATSAPPATPTPGGPPTPTVTPLPGSANLAGATDICTTAISVSTTLPPEIPPYSGQLRLAQSSGGAAEFGYCSTDSVATIAAYYSAQLPAKGWQNIQTFVNGGTRNIIATRGGENLTVTVSPDVVQTGSADLLIIETGRSG